MLIGDVDIALQHTTFASSAACASRCPDVRRAAVSSRLSAARAARPDVASASTRCDFALLDAENLLTAEDRHGPNDEEGIAHARAA